MPDAAKPTWLGRNWKWVVPVGCLVPVLVCGGCIATVFFGVFGMIKSSEPYTEAVAKAKANDEVKDLLGTPIEEGFFVTGNIQITNDSGNADLAIPISGPKGSATIKAVGTRSEGKWDYSTLEVVGGGSDERIDLLTEDGT